MKSSSSMVPIAPENQQGLSEALYTSFMSNTSGTNITGDSFASKYEESPSSDNVGGEGGQNHTLHLVNPLASLPPKSKSQHMSMMKP
jgi:hypothetical protein